MSSGFVAFKGDKWHASNESPRISLDTSHNVRPHSFIRFEVSEEEGLKDELELPEEYAIGNTILMHFNIEAPRKQLSSFYDQKNHLRNVKM